MAKPPLAALDRSCMSMLNLPGSHWLREASRARVRAARLYTYACARCPSGYMCGIINHELNPSNSGFPHP
jgi:hypothetical protein